MTRGALAIAAATVAALVPTGAATAGASPSAGDDRWALVVGISRHAGRTKGTVGGAGDAAAVARALREAGWRSDRVRVLVDGAATAAGIRQGLDWLASNAGSRSFSVFHYSGHVLQRGGDRDRDGEALDEYLMPHDSRNLVSDRELSQRLQRVQGALWVDISGCESAGFDEGGLSSPRRLVTTSSAESEKSYEHPGWRMSVFTGLLVQQGMLERAADFDRNAYVSIHEAFRYAAEHAPVITSRQKTGPQHPYIAGGDGGEWFLRAPPPAAATGDRGPRVCVVGSLCL